jgi:3-dehydro-L-gulonate 2-dehydrogenase
MRLMRVAYQDLQDVLCRVLATTGMAPDRAALCARLFADSTRDGVASHGLNRFPRFMTMIRAGTIDVGAEPIKVASHGGLERWDGRRGPGNLNAWMSMERAIVLAREHGIGCVAVANTNHWMRGGTYGWQAADAGLVGICWTNTLPNLPPWGATSSRIGNNPLVVAVPRPLGHVVLDMAMSQFSVGAVAGYRMRGEQLPVAGGYDAEGSLTRDPAAIEASGRPLPIGFWKGSGLSIVLDMMAAMLSGGRAVHQITADPERETGLSQVFIAMSPSLVGDEADAAHMADLIVEHLQPPPPAAERVRYPGERTLETRRGNLRDGIPVDPGVWDAVQRL